MKQNKKLYLYSDTSICCAGKTWDASLQKALYTPEYTQSFQTMTIGELRCPVARIPDAWLSSPSNGLRVEALLEQILEQVTEPVAECIRRYGANRVGVCAGSCDNGSEASLEAHETFFSQGSFPDGYSLRQQNPAQVADYIQTRLGTAGPAVTVATACASSATAVIEAAQLVLADICDAVLVAGVDLVSPTVFMGFNALEAVSSTGCNPFSSNRKGITLGEAATCVIVSRDKPATNNYVELLGFGESADANHMTAPLETGDGAVAAMEQAILMAGIQRNEISYVNLHGTGTPLNDAMESRAIAKVFPETYCEGGRLKVSSTKAITGHTLGAAGCLELSICMRTLYDKSMKGRLPIHHWDGQRDPDLPRLQFAAAGDKITSQLCMTNSFAFGGCNTSLIIGRKET
ncbi:MAG: 3-oxoacyl-ACP synthase [Spirochaetaceae bacterium]|nr:3-oxoacyl-ACP synthase [Spirochaetaceae bacterium]